jgi:hypothetical protein
MRLPRDHDQSVELLRRAMDLGVNFFDTAMGYVQGESEVMLGKAVAGRRDQVYLSTKNACREWTNDSWRRRLESSLEKMGTDYLDFYCVVHGLTWHDHVNHFSKPNGGLEAALQAQEEGLLHHLCFSSHEHSENLIKLVDTGLFQGMIIQYNLLDRRTEDGIAHAGENDMGVVVMGPVAGGRLAHRSAQIEDMADVAVQSIPELALRFVLSNPHVTCALSGMNTMDMLEENVATASREEPLSSAEREQIEAAVAENERLAQLYCTGCNYCLPCPQNVALPEIFSLMNLHRLWGLTEHARSAYARFGPDNREGKLDASACVECGVCETKCPQDLEIIRQLRESHQALASD